MASACQTRSAFPVRVPQAITGELKSKIDVIWNAFWSGGIANPLEVIEQITYLLFIRRLDDLQTLAKKKAGVMRPGGVWRLATDWREYGEQMITVLDAEPLLEGGEVERWVERPITRFERKGLDVGRSITDLSYRRRS